MSDTAKAVAAAGVAATVFGLLALALERNPWIATFAAGVLGVLVFFATRSYYAQLARLAAPDDPSPLSRWAIPFTPSWHTRRLVAAGRIDEAGRRLSGADDWAGARSLIAGSVAIREAREALLRLLQASRSLDEMQAALPPATPDPFRGLARETALDVSDRLWAKTAILARLSRVALPTTAHAEVVAEAGRIDELAMQVEGATTDLLRLSLAGYDSHGVRRGTELLAAVRHKAAVLLSIGEEAENSPS